jgi:RNA polymerase sigma-70 factor, ECF subfamily
MMGGEVARASCLCCRRDRLENLSYCRCRREDRLRVCPTWNFFPARSVASSETNVTDNTQLSDAQLVRETLAGRSEAFGQLVLKYQDRLFNAVLHVVANAADARDIVQEALVQAFLKLESFRQQSAFYTWLYRIAFNAAISHKRRQRPMASVERARETCHMEPSDHEPGPAAVLDCKEQCRQVREAIAQLADDHRTVLVLREIDGCNYETIAEILALPVGTVRSRLHRARLQLREMLKEMLVP